MPIDRAIIESLKSLGNPRTVEMTETKDGGSSLHVEFFGQSGEWTGKQTQTKNEVENGS